MQETTPTDFNCSRLDRKEKAKEKGTVFIDIWDQPYVQCSTCSSRCFTGPQGFGRCLWGYKRRNGNFTDQGKIKESITCGFTKDRLYLAACEPPRSQGKEYLMTRHLSLFAMLVLITVGVSAASERTTSTDTDNGFIWKSEVPDDCPFKQSQTLTAIFFTGRHSDYRCGDTFYLSWAIDGHLYYPWTY